MGSIEAQADQPAKRLWSMPVAVYWLALAFIALCVAFITARAFTAPQDFDGAYIASVSKNLADGQGYRTTYQPIQGYVDRNREDPSRLFNAEITTGPGMIVPGALVFFLLGDGYWVTGLAAVILNVALIAAAFMFVRWKVLPEDRESWRFFVVVAAALLVALTTNIMHPGAQQSILRHWFEFIGEIVASGYVVLGVLIAAFSRGKVAQIFLAGFLFGLAAQTKSLALIQILVVTPLLAWHLSATVRNWKQMAVAAVAAVAGYALPNLLVMFWMFLSMTPADRLEQADATVRVFSDAGSGLSQLRAAPDRIAYILQNVAAHADVLKGVFTPLDLILVGAIFLICFAVVFREAVQSKLGFARPFDPWVVAGGALTIAAAIQIGWWFTLEFGPWIRRLTQAVAIFAIGAPLLLMMTRWRPARALVAVLAISLVIMPAFRIGEAFAALKGRDANLEAAIHVVDLLEKEEAKGAVGLGCAFDGNRELELYRPGQRNFVDCLNVPPFAWGKPGILVQGGYFSMLAANEPGVKAAIEACESPFLIEPPYTVRRCSVGALTPRYIRVGVYEEGEDRFWTEKSAVLPLAHLGPARDLKLEIYAANPDIATNPLGGIVRVENGTSTVFEVKLEFTEQARLHEITIPKTMMKAGDRLRIEVDRDFVPRDFGQGPDERPLGVLVTLGNPVREGFFADDWIGAKASIPVTMQLRAKGGVIAMYAANPDLANNPLDVAVSYLADGQPIFETTFRLTAAQALAELKLDSALLNNADRIELTPGRTFNAAALGISEDTRDLGAVVTLTHPTP